MKKLVALLSIAVTCAYGQAAWFTVVGDLSDPAADIIEVDPMPLSISASEGLRTLRVRVSRATPRTSWDGVPYRAYESLVVFDCFNHTAQYSTLVFYMQPAWRGVSHNTTVYAKANPRWMEFRDVVPNPTARIIRAACRNH